MRAAAGRAGAGDGRPHRGRRGTRADRARAPRHRRPRRQRHGPSGRRRPAQAAPAAHPEDEEALEGVERTGRTALAEMRRLLGAMRREGDDVELGPQPGLGRPRRARPSRSAAPAFRCACTPTASPTRSPTRSTSPPTGSSRRASPTRSSTRAPSQADVTVRYGSDELGIEVRDDGDGAAPGDGLGHGLVGIRERVKIYGGEMTAGTASEGGFVLSTRLPLRGHGS